MLHWNYRLIKYRNKPEYIEDFGKYYYGIVETYYTQDNKIWSITEEPLLTGNSPEEIKRDLSNMLKSLEAELLDNETLEFSKPDFKEDYTVIEAEKLTSVKDLIKELKRKKNK